MLLHLRWRTSTGHQPVARQPSSLGWARGLWPWIELISGSPPKRPFPAPNCLQAPGAPSGSLGSAHGNAAQLLGFQEQLLATEQLPYTAGERGRSRQRSAPAADSGMHPSDALGNGFLGGSQLGSAGYAIGSHAPRSASAPPGRMQLGAAGGATDPALAQLQRAQQELRQTICFDICSMVFGVAALLGCLQQDALYMAALVAAHHSCSIMPFVPGPFGLQRQRDEQSQWAAAAQQLLRSHGHGLPQSTSPQDPQQQLPPLPSLGGVPRRPASLDLQPSNDLCRTFASLQADLGVIDQRQHDWEARWAAHQAGLAQEQSQWETRRAAEQWSWEMRQQAEEQAWRQARQQQEEAWLEKRRQEEREWLDKRRREEQEQREARQRAEQQWQRECQALQLQQQQVTVEVRQLPQVGAAGRPAFALPQGKPPASYSGGGNGEGASGSGSGTSGSGSCGLPPPPLPAVLEGVSDLKAGVLDSRWLGSAFGGLGCA